MSIDTGVFGRKAYVRADKHFCTTCGKATQTQCRAMLSEVIPVMNVTGESYKGKPIKHHYCPKCDTQHKIVCDRKTPRTWQLIKRGQWERDYKNDRD